jgi:hypothetical protein
VTGACELMVATAVALDPEVRLTEVGATAQLGWYAALLVLSAQDRFTVPEKPVAAVTVMFSVLPVVAPEAIVSGPAADSVNGGLTVTAMHGCVELPHADAAESVAPAVVPVPVTTRLSTP